MASRKTWVTALLFGVVLSGCDTKKQSAADGATSATVPSPSASKSKSKFPPEARRNSAPRGIADRALAVGGTAPVLKNLPSTTGTWSRGERVTALVFYRGHW
jgi:hypothetical protein